MTPAQLLFRAHRAVTGGPRRRNVDAPTISFARRYHRHVDAHIESCGQSDADTVFRMWNWPDRGESFTHSKPLGRTS